MIPEWVCAWEISLATINRAAKKYEIPTRFVMAIIAQESMCNPFRTRKEPKWKYFTDKSGKPISEKSATTFLEPQEIELQRTSMGLMQVMGSVAREMGYFGKLEDLLNVETNLDWGCKKLRMLINKHKTLQDAAEAYNAGKPVVGPETTPYGESVMHYYKELTDGATPPPPPST